MEILNSDLLPELNINSEKNIQYLDQLTDILIKDRDGNGKLSVNDILLIKKDILSIFYLTSVLVCLVENINANNITQLFLYIFIKLIPEKTGIKLINTEEDKQNILVVIDLIHTFLIKSVGIKNIKKSLENTYCCKLLSDINQKIIIKKNQKFLISQINFLK